MCVCVAVQSVIRLRPDQGQRPARTWPYVPLRRRAARDECQRRRVVAGATAATRRWPRRHRHHPQQETVTAATVSVEPRPSALT